MMGVRCEKCEKWNCKCEPWPRESEAEKAERRQLRFAAIDKATRKADMQATRERIGQWNLGYVVDHSAEGQDWR